MKKIFKKLLGIEDLPPNATTQQPLPTMQISAPVALRPGGTDGRGIPYNLYDHPDPAAVKTQAQQAMATSHGVIGHPHSGLPTQPAPAAVPGYVLGGSSDQTALPKRAPTPAPAANPFALPDNNLPGYVIGGPNDVTANAQKPAAITSTIGMKAPATPPAGGNRERVLA